MSQPAQSPPPHAALLQMILGKWVSSAISAAAHFGIADHLESGPKSPKELASLTGTQEQPLYRLLARQRERRRVHGTGGRAFRADSAFRTAANERQTLRPPHGDDADGRLAHSRLGAIAVVRRNRQAGIVQAERHANVRLDGAASGKDRELQSGDDRSVPGRCAAVVQSYDFSRFEHIVDVAGGHGTLLAAILDQALRSCAEPCSICRT